jgi:glycosyltransferase involved in cell wall biosynthesis
MADSTKQIVALIPAYNEARELGPVVEAALSYLPVLVVDDGSSDDTAAIAESRGASVVRHSVNRGKGAALRSGFERALADGALAVVTLDADGQHDPHEIPKLLAAYAESDAHLVIGRRQFGQMPFPRNFSNPFGSWLLSVVTGERILDNQSGFRLYDRKLLERLDLNNIGFEFEVEVIGTAIKNDLDIAWVEVATIYHTETTSYFHPIFDSIKFMQTVWRARRWRRPNPDGVKVPAQVDSK